MRNAITVKSLGQGKYQAVWVPQSFTLGPEMAKRILNIEGISEAIGRNPEIGDDRKDFLKGRIDYWKQWASSAGSNHYIPSDRL